MIADAFRAVRYPILPKIKLTRSRQAIEQILEIRHSSLYCPRDFDISPFFNVVKPTIARGFDYTTLPWVQSAGAPEGALGRDRLCFPESAIPEAFIAAEAPLVPLAAHESPRAEAIAV